MTNFIGRQDELSFLVEEYETGRGSFIPVYGRRRVGKSTLLVEFMRGRPSIYHLGKESTAEANLREFLESAAIALDEPVLARMAATGWHDALATVVARWKGESRLIIALDEFQWTAAASPELIGTLQHLWDRDWQHNHRVMLVVCGSWVGFMAREILGAKSPLFGRRTGQIHLRNFDFRTARAFHPTYSLEEAARVWFICGGVPAYHLAFDPEQSLETNLVRSLLLDFGPLRQEPDFLLREELRDVHSYYAVLAELAKGSLTLRQLAGACGIAAGSISYYADQLVGLGYVRRRYPMDGRPPRKRDVRFALNDALLRFWFRFVFPNGSFLQQAGPERILRERIKPELPAWFGVRFEEMCRAALPGILRREGVLAAVEVGEYWDKTVQIDVVGVRDDDWIELGECKWGSATTPATAGKEMVQMARRFPNPTRASLSHRVFARSAGEVHGCKWHSLEEIYHPVK